GALDQLSIQLSGAAQLDGRTPSAPGAAVKLPIATAIYLPDASGAVDIGVVGLRFGAAVGQGGTTVSIRPSAHVAATVELVTAIGGGGDDLAIGDGSSDDLANGGSTDLARNDLAGLLPRYVFLLPSQSSNLGAESGLDTQCTTAAATGGLPTTSYRAVISYPTMSPRTTLDLTAGRDIVRPDGTEVATDSTFLSMMHEAPIDELADGTVADGCVFADFGPSGDRIPANNGDCGGWTGDTSMSAYVGDSSKSDMNWSFSAPQSCSGLSCYVYCIQQ
ncbi:MAG TPA: hypothetical protein VGL86_16830, partial [Polyangia bacterium]